MIWNYNILQTKRDKLTEMFIQGKISKEAFFELDEYFEKTATLFNICLN
jgi:hypothetical protein